MQEEKIGGTKKGVAGGRDWGEQEKKREWEDEKIARNRKRRKRVRQIVKQHGLKGIDEYIRIGE